MTTAASPPDGSIDPDVPNAVDTDDAALSWGDADDATHVDAAHNPVAVRDRGARDPEAPETSGCTRRVRHLRWPLPALHGGLAPHRVDRVRLRRRHGP
ncbi:hypothetical protein Q9Q99_05515 [Curtobacterium flaccumfaciens]|nr:hypothetical protein Q9Q99_05515 [Curtobacterium flaccumfaciens]